jgi:hypothetical protein
VNDDKTTPDAASAATGSTAALSLVSLPKQRNEGGVAQTHA